jgi:hypothetical protein
LATIDAVAAPPAEDTLTAFVGRLNSHGGAAACVTVSVLPAIVSVAERAVVAVFAEYAYATVALPVPEPLPGLGAIHDWLLVAVHAHVEADAVSATVPEPAAAGTDAVEDASAYVHGALPACVMLKLCVGQKSV